MSEKDISEKDIHYFYSAKCSEIINGPLGAPTDAPFPDQNDNLTNDTCFTHIHLSPPTLELSQHWISNATSKL